MIKKIFISILLSLIFCNPALSQEAAKDQILEFSNFAGGLATKPVDIGLPTNYATVLENGRLNDEAKSLSKRQQILAYGTADTTESITGMTRLYLWDGTKKLVVTHGDEMEVGSDTSGAFTNILNLSSSGYKWQFLTWHNILIGTDGYSQPVKWDGNSASATYLGSLLATDAGSGAGPNGTYTYKVSFYTTTYEVEFNIASNPVIVTDNDINLSMIPIAPDTYLGEAITGRKIYRIANGGSTYYLLSNGTIVNNTATTLTDSDADLDTDGGSELTTTAYPTVDNITKFAESPPKGKYLVVHENRLWLANNPSSAPSRAYYSADSSHDYFDSLAYFDIRLNDGDEITFIISSRGNLVTSKNNSIQKIYTDGDDPDAEWKVSPPFSHVGCKAPYSAVDTPEGIYYLSYGELWKFTGNYSLLVSDIIAPTLTDILESNFINCWGIYHKNTYYLAYASKAQGEAENNRVLVYDLISKSFTIDLLKINAFCAFNSGSDWDVLYSGASDSGKVYAHNTDGYEVIHKKHSDFTGTWDDMRYVPTGTPGGDANNPVIELAWTETLGDISTAIGDVTATSIIARLDIDGTYRSQVLDLNAPLFDKLYWNQNLNTYGTVEMYIASAATVASCPTATLSSAFTDPTGSDLSDLTPGRYVQYVASMATTSIAYSPTLYRNNNFVVKLTYFREATVSETTIPLKWESGWIVPAPGYTCSLKKIEAHYESAETGTLNITFENDTGTENLFAINLHDNPSDYTGRFTTGQLNGTKFKMKIDENSLNPITIKRILVVYSVQPMR